MYLCQKKYGPRIEGVAKIRKLSDQLETMESILKQLKSDKEQLAEQKSIAALKQQMADSVEKIKRSAKISQKEIGKIYDELFHACEKDMKKLKSMIESQKNREEQERLRRIQEDLARAQALQQEEEAKKAAEEEIRRQKAEIEARRKLEEEKQKKKDKENEKNKGKLEAKFREEKEEEAKQASLLEQEKRDHDLAMRLASEVGSGEVEPMRSPKKAVAGKGKHDLSKWKYAELRDAINTSCDLELLESCREEFHRRLKVYHAWKSKNKKQNTGRSLADGCLGIWRLFF